MNNSIENHEVSGLNEKINKVKRFLKLKIFYLNNVNFINKLIDSSNLKFKNDEKTSKPIEYLQRLFKQCDSNKLESAVLIKLILKGQESVDNVEASREDFAKG